jgi:hypothetical protein
MIATAGPGPWRFTAARSCKENCLEPSVPNPGSVRLLFGIAARRHVVIGVALAFLVLGSALGYGVGMVTISRPPAPGPAAARYMVGLQQMDGAELWASMSPDMQGKAIREGDSPAAFADFYRGLKERGNRIDQVQYVGGYQTKEKGLFVYVTRRFDPGKEPIEIVWVLVTGPEGLIDYVF